MNNAENITSSPNSSNAMLQAVPFSHGSLFSGIGGFDLAASWCGWTNVFQCEKDEWCRKVLAKNFPASKQYSDIKDFSGNEYKGTIDVISGGFPCQPFSIAGQRKGKDDDRYLWEEMLRVVGEIKPSYVVGENVTGIIGMALDTVLSDLEAQGYTTETFIIPACGKNAWHRRDRVWIVAYSNGIRWNNERKTKEQSRGKQQRRASKSGAIFSNTESKLSNERENGNNTEQRKIQLQTGGSDSISTDTNGIGWQNGLYGKEQGGETSKLGNTYTEQYRNYWEVEPELGRVVDGIPRRMDRLKGLGNAIVPQIAYEIFKSLGCVHRHCL